MKALILVGGFGTRLRPLTWTRPKPMVPFANRPMVLHQVAALKKVGVTEVVLAVNYQSETFNAVLAQWTQEFGVKFSISLEKEPMGTAGPLALARKILTETDAPFFVLNSDVIVAFEEHQILQKMVAFHKSHGKEGTMLVTRVTDPSKYGVVVSDATGRINAFVEKPKEFVGDCINAGIYLFDQKVLQRIELKPTSIERETFPAMIRDGQLYSQTVTGFWMDIGQPKDYLVGMEMFLRDTADGKYAASHVDVKALGPAAADVKLTGNVLLDPTLRVGAGCTIGPDVIVGRNVVLGAGVTLQRCTVMDGTRIEAGATVSSSIVAYNCLLRERSRVHESTLGDAVVVNPSAVVSDAKLFNEHTSGWTAHAAAARSAAVAVFNTAASDAALVSPVAPAPASKKAPAAEPRALVVDGVVDVALIADTVFAYLLV